MIKRYQKSLKFLEKHVPHGSTIFDLGVENTFSKIMEQAGYSVENTIGEDLDENIDAAKLSGAEVVTAFEIIEHLLNPYTVLKALSAKKLIVSVPLRLWFAKAYRNPDNERDWHFHEFEEWQFNWLLEKTGWKIIDRQKWTNPSGGIGIRPLFRLFTPRYYIIYAERLT